MNGSARHCGPHVPDINSLPGEAIVRCLGYLTLKERLKTVCLVSKRFHQLCMAPELLRAVQLAAIGPIAVPRLRCMQAFLTRHAAHVQRFTLHATARDPLGGEEDEVEEISVEQQAEVQGLVLQCLQLLGAAGELLELAVSAATPVSSSGWLGSLSKLQVLWLGTGDGQLQLPPGFSNLTSLRQVGLRGERVQLSPADYLPASITRLHLDGPKSEEFLAGQLPELTNLLTLEILNSTLQRTSLQQLTAMTNLRALQLDGPTALPTCLPTLTHLQQLELQSTHDLSIDQYQLVDKALSQLQHLTCLVLGCYPMLSIPPAVAQLASLQRLLFFTVRELPEPEGAPPGPWLASIRWLGLPWRTMRRSVEVLKGAPRLEYLGLVDVPFQYEPDWGELGVEGDPDGDEALWAAFWDFLATHPLLRCLGLDMGPPEQPLITMALLDALVALARRRPGLDIRRTPTPLHDLSWCRSNVPDRDQFFFLWEEFAAAPSLPLSGC